MRKIIFLSLLVLSSVFILQGQNIGIKTNLLADLTTTINLGAEIGLGKKTTLDIYGNYNPWSYTNQRKFRQVLVQPEFRYWFCERFNAHFVGIHLHGALFNVGGVTMPFNMWTKLKDYRYEGGLYGAGISYGYQWVLSTHWNLEANVGVGYAHIIYEQYRCRHCGKKVKEGHYNYVGPTKAALSLMYLF
ncbi:MAG: DUF3575 domain-containing protein [Odoribacter sp.]